MTPTHVFVAKPPGEAEGRGLLRKLIALFALALTLAAGGATVLIVHPRPAAASASILTLACRAQRIVFNDGASFAASHFIVAIDPDRGWSIDYDQFVKRFPEGVTVTIARETGAYVKFDESSHLQIGRCRTVNPASQGRPFRGLRAAHRG